MVICNISFVVIINVISKSILNFGKKKSEYSSSSKDALDFLIFDAIRIDKRFLDMKLIRKSSPVRFFENFYFFFMIFYD